MLKLDKLNEVGYGALRSLCTSNPALFTKPDALGLRDAMSKEAGTESVTAGAIELLCPLDELNEVDQSGPGTDAQYAKIIRSALANLSVGEATDELLWASINCFALADYVPLRWSTSNIRNNKPSSFVETHWLKGGGEGRQDNAAARLWWLGELSSRAAQFSIHSADELLDAMANHVNLYHQTLYRRYILANPRLVAAIYDMFLDGNSHLNITKTANDFYKTLNVRAGATALDMMDEDQLRSVVEEAKPPKGR